MKYLNKNDMQVDTEIYSMHSIGLHNSAFKRVIPFAAMRELREQYNNYLSKQVNQQMLAEFRNDEFWPISTQVIKVNIAPLREAGYCYCPEDLAAACEILLRQQEDRKVQCSESEMNNLMRSKNANIAETVESEGWNDHETTTSKSMDVSTEELGLDKVHTDKKRKAYPAKVGKDEDSSNRNISDKSKKSHLVREKKRKYFTKYMSKEFSKDVKPVSMSEMDTKTQNLFRDQEFNELVSEITGMN